MAVAADRTEGDIIIEGVGEDSGESEGRTALRGDRGWMDLQYGVRRKPGILARKTTVEILF